MLRGAILLLFLAVGSPAPAADVSGSKDVEGVDRFEGSEILFYETESYGRTTLATGAVTTTSDVESTSLALEGEITRIVYGVPEGASALEVFRNFESRLDEAGYETIFSGGPEEIHRYTFMYGHPVEKPRSTSFGNEVWYLSARRVAEGREMYISLSVSPHSGGKGQRVRIVAANRGEMKLRMLDAGEMREDLLESGRVALYGTYFDAGRAEVLQKSKGTLTQIARLLGDDPALQIVVVGHTDDRGGYEYDLDLSRRRAASVSRRLQSDHGIAKGRLQSAGVGYLAPAASNSTESGRAPNRRV